MGSEQNRTPGQFIQCNRGSLAAEPGDYVVVDTEKKTIVAVCAGDFKTGPAHSMGIVRMKWMADARDGMVDSGSRSVELVDREEPKERSVAMPVGKKKMVIGESVLREVQYRVCTGNQKESDQELIDACISFVCRNCLQ